MKKVAMFATVAAALAGLAIPASASAIWQHNGGTLSQNVQIQNTGTAGFVSGGLGIECQIDSKVKLLAGQTTAEVETFEPDLTEAGSTVTSKCFVTPGLESLGCVDVHSVTPEGLPWSAHALSAQTLAVTFGGFQQHLSGGLFCPKTTTTTPGTVHISTAQNPFHTGQLSGTLQTHNPALQVQVTGSGTVTPANTYGG